MQRLRGLRLNEWPREVFCKQHCAHERQMDEVCRAVDVMAERQTRSLEEGARFKIIDLPPQVS